MACDNCGENPNIHLKYYDQRLCGSCFNRLFERRVRKTVRLNKLLPTSGKIGVALSGGKDSMTILNLLNDLTSKNPKLSVEVLIIDEGITGKKPVFDGCYNYCDELGITYHSYSFKNEYGIKLDDIMKKVHDDGVNACTYCGVLRRRLINSKAMEHGISRIATGHNLDDEVQSALMNFIRGEYDRIARLGPLVGAVKDKRFVPRIKPLRDCLEEEVRIYADYNKIPYIQFDCPNSIEAYRKSIKSLIDDMEEKHPGSKYQMLASTDRLIEMIKPNIIGQKMKYCDECGEPSSSKKCKVCLLLEKISKHS